MSNGVPNTALPDLITHSLADFKDRGSFGVVFDQTSYAFEDFLQEGRYRVQSGNGVEGRMVLGTNGSFRFVNKFQVTPRDYVDVFSKWRAEWCYAEAKCHYEARTMEEMQGEAELVDYMKGQFFAGVRDAVEGIELALWSAPNDSTDTETPFGIPWHICLLDTGTVDYTGSFTGKTARYGDGSSTTATTLGVNRTTTPKFRNWAANRTAAFNAQVLDTIARGARKTGFKPPRDIREYANPKKPKRMIFSSQDDALEYERLANLGPDLKNGDLRRFRADAGEALDFRGMEWRGVSALDGKTYSPIYCTPIGDGGTFVAVKNGWWMRKTEPMNDRDQPHLYTVQLDFEYQVINEMPRNCFVVHTPT